MKLQTDRAEKDYEKDYAAGRNNLAASAIT